MKKKKIIFVHNVVYPQQWSVDVFYYSKYLSRYEDMDISVIVSQAKYDPSNNQINFYPTGKVNYFSFVVKALRTIRQLNKQQKIDYVYFFAQHPFSVLVQIITKYIYHIPTIYDVDSGNIGRWFISWLAKRTIKTWVLLSSKYVILDKWLIKKLQLSHKKPHIIVPMWYDPETFKPQQQDLFKRSKDDIIFTYVGTLDKTRNLEIFVQAFIDNLDRHPSLHLYIIGWGNWKQNIRTISKNHSDYIHFVGKVPHEQIPAYIASSDVMVSYVPKQDYFEYQPPTKLIEYLGCNKPVIATNTIAQEEILIGYEDLVHSDDRQSTSEKIDYIVTHLWEISQRDYTHLVEQYTREKLVEKLKKFVDQ